MESEKDIFLPIEKEESWIDLGEGIIIEEVHSQSEKAGIDTSEEEKDLSGLELSQEKPLAEQNFNLIKNDDDDIAEEQAPNEIVPSAQNMVLPPEGHQPMMLGHKVKISKILIHKTGFQSKDDFKIELVFSQEKPVIEETFNLIRPFDDVTEEQSPHDYAIEDYSSHDYATEEQSPHDYAAEEQSLHDNIAPSTQNISKRDSIMFGRNRKISKILIHKAAFLNKDEFEIELVFGKRRRGKKRGKKSNDIEQSDFWFLAAIILAFIGFCIGFLSGLQESAFSADELFYPNYYLA